MYLDWNATAPMSSNVREKLQWANEHCWANPDSQHSLGRRAAVEIEKVREGLALRLGVRSKSVRFTSGATESNSWVLRHFKQKGKIACSAVEHPSVFEYGDIVIPVDANGIIALQEFKRILEQKKPALVSIMAANNETGVLSPIEEISRICRFYQIPFHCDASQILGRVQPNIPADFITISGHKFGAPKGVGALIVQQEISALFLGGPQERGSRAGTVNVPSIVAMGEALEQCAVMSSLEQDLFEEMLLRTGAQIIGKSVDRLPNTTCALFSTPGDLLVMSLDMKDISVSTGSACSSGSSKDSRVLANMGIIGKPVRFSWGPNDSLSSVHKVIESTIEQLEMSCEW